MEFILDESELMAASRLLLLKWNFWWLTKVKETPIIIIVIIIVTIMMDVNIILEVRPSSTIPTLGSDLSFSRINDSSSSILVSGQLSPIPTSPPSPRPPHRSIFLPPRPPRTVSVRRPPDSHPSTRLQFKKPFNSCHSAGPTISPADKAQTGTPTPHPPPPHTKSRID